MLFTNQDDMLLSTSFANENNVLARSLRTGAFFYLG